MLTPSSRKRVAARACDACKRRKIKCDDTPPQCSNCRMSALECTYNVPMRKRGPRPRTTSTTDQNTGGEVTTTHSILSPTSEIPPSGSTDSTVPQWSPAVYQDVLSHVVARSPMLDVLARLQASLNAVLPGIPIETVVTECLDLYMQNIFPVAPLVHETSARNNLSLFPHGYDSTQDWPSPGWSMDIDVEDLAVMRAFALSAAICAETASLLPSSIFPTGPLVSGPFLRASRDMLNYYMDKDVENPNSSSLIIRYFHCNCIHAAGKTRVAWYKLGEAIRLAQDMRLHDEASLTNLDPVEAQLRRNVFWQLYTGDKSAAVLNKRPFTLHEFSFDTKINVAFNDQHQSPSLLDPSRDENTGSFEECLKTGFDMCQRIWTLSSNLLFDLHLLRSSSSRLLGTAALNEEQRTALMDAYLEYVSVLDNMAPFLQDAQSPKIANETIRRYQTRSFCIQRVNLQVSYQCLKLILLQKFADAGLSSLLGISSEPVMLALRKTEIAQAMLDVLREAPFEALQINGEPCVEKIRLVGASLLETMQNTKSAQLVARAKSDFHVLLDVLARLDSRACDVLCSDMNIER